MNYGWTTNWTANWTARLAVQSSPVQLLDCKPGLDWTLQSSSPVQLPTPAKFRAERAAPTDVLNVNEDPSPSEGPVQKRPAKKIVEEGHISSKDNDIFGIRERTTGQKLSLIHI